MRTKAKKRKASDLDRLKIRYKIMYNTWKKVRCPALNAEVLFTNLGWEHLCVRKWRTTKDQEKRIQLLPLAKKLLEITTTIQSTRFQNGFMTYEFNAILDGKRVTAVISKTKEGFTFFSNFTD